MKFLYQLSQISNLQLLLAQGCLGIHWVLEILLHLVIQGIQDHLGYRKDLQKITNIVEFTGLI